MESERRINIRIDQEMYQRLDDKRHAERQSWQALGAGFFIEWLVGERATPPPDPTAQITDEDRNTADRLLWWVRAAQKGGLGLNNPSAELVYKSIAEAVLHAVGLIREGKSDHNEK